MVRELMPCFGNSARNQAKVSANCENTKTLVGTTASSSSSFCEIFFNSSQELLVWRSTARRLSAYLQMV